MFGGKGKFVSFFPKAKDLFEVMCQLEDTMKIHAFFVMDENFLLQRTRAMELLELMRQHNKSWAFYVFSSANAIRMYTMDELVSLGISWLWLGLEGENSQYGKLGGTDTRKLVAELQDNGIRVLGSSIIGMEDHTPENMSAAISYAVSHNTDFHQFMLYTPVAGTPLYAQHEQQGTLLGPDEIAFEDTHGQFRFNFRHPHIKNGQETAYLLKAFTEDFQVNGPSVMRVIRTTLKGYLKHRNHPEARVRARYVWEMDGACSAFPAAVWAGRKWFAHNVPVSQHLDELLKELVKTFGWRARLAAPVLGRYAFRKLTQETARLEAGQTYEPPTYYERNYADPSAATPATMARSVGQLAKEAAKV